MRISDSQLDALNYSAEELQDLAHLIERIIDENSDRATGEEMRELGILWELILESSKTLKAIRNKRKD